MYSNSRELNALIVVAGGGDLGSIDVGRLDDTKLTDLALNHRLPVVAWRCLSEAGADHLHLLKEAAESVRFQTLRQVKVLLDLTSAFDKAGIPSVCLKGPALAARWYDSPLDRMSRDIDLLTIPADYERAAQVMLNEQAFVEEPDSDPQSHHRVFRREGVLVELHQRVFAHSVASILPDCSALIDESDSVMVAGQQVRVLTVDEEILYLTSHGSSHRWARLRWLQDLRQILERRPETDWDALVSEARERDSLRSFLLGWKLLAFELGVSVPEPLAKRFPVGTGRTYNSCRRSWSQFDIEVKTPIRRTLYRARLRDTIPDKAKYLFGVLFRVTGSELEKHPGRPSLAAVRRFGMILRRVVFGTPSVPK